MKNEYKIGIIVVLLLIAGYFAFLIPFFAIIGCSYLAFRFIDNKILAGIISFFVITYLSSVFSLIIFYHESTRFITQLDAAMTIITWATVTNYVNLFTNIWTTTVGIGLQWWIFGICTGITLAGVAFVFIRNNADL